MGQHSFKAHINKTVISRLHPGDTVFDSALKGFGARRQKHCVSYFLKTCVNSKQCFITIGKHGLPWTPDTARRQAMAYKADPSLANKKEKEDTNSTVSEIIEPFKQSHFPQLKPGTVKDYQSILDLKILPHLGEKLIGEISKKDVTRFHQSLSETPRRANLALAILSIIMNWAEEHGFRSANSNPCTGIKKFPAKKRQRYLTKEELTRLGKAICDIEASGKVSIYAAAAIRLLIFTGARTGEILNLKHEYISYDQALILLPDSKTGAKTIKLSEPAMGVLRSLPRDNNSEYVILGRIPGKPLVNISKPWKVIREAAKIENCRLHDLRHSYASLLAASGASLLMIGKLLGHASTQTTARYTHLADEPVVQLNKEVGETINDLMSPASSENLK